MLNKIEFIELFVSRQISRLKNLNAPGGFIRRNWNFGKRTQILNKRNGKKSK